MLSLFGTGDVPALIDGVPHSLSRAGARVLNELAPHFECAWCTGWEDRADEHLPYLLALPRGWPHLTFPEGGRHWKLAGIDAYAGPDRALAWIDDEHDDACREWAAARRGPTLLVTTSPTDGLLPEHADVLRDWARSITESSSTA